MKNAHWHKQKYEEGVSLQGETKFASYLPEAPEANRTKLSENYSLRGVKLSNIDAHLHFPEIQLFDEGVYICDVQLAAISGAIEVEVLGMFAAYNITAAYINKDMEQCQLSVIWEVDYIP